MLQDPISNLLACIHLGFKNKNIRIVLKKIKSYIPVLDILYQHNYIRGYVLYSDKILVFFKVLPSQILVQISRISKPSNKVYCNVATLRRLQNNCVYLVSTNLGILTHTQAILHSRGGEVLCVIS